MLHARRAFLEAGYYDPLKDRLNRLVEETAESLNIGEVCVLDAGCGEGFYLRRLQQVAAERQSMIRCGVDISRDAIRLAARRDPGGVYAVASVYDLPLIAASVDVLLSVFAHRSFSQFARVLRRGSVLASVHPGPDHLVELRRLLSADPRLRREQTQRRVRCGPLRRIGCERLRYTIELATQRDLANLLAMTPFAAHAPRSGQERVRSTQGLAVSVDFVITRFTAG
jgi:23S rRNA (guanine745-N1)-methyltransferase